MPPKLPFARQPNCLRCFRRIFKPYTFSRDKLRRGPIGHQRKCSDAEPAGLVRCASYYARSLHLREARRFYQADAVVTGIDLRQRPWGFAQCLKEVLVKVSGDPRLRDDPRVLALADHADEFVTAFGYVDQMAGVPKKDDQGFSERPHRLTVFFDPIKIGQALAQWGTQPWTGERPIVVPLLLISGPRPPAYLLDADDPARADQRAAFAAAATEFGLGARVPSAADLAAWGVTPEHFRFPAAPPPEAKSAEQAIVAGTLTWTESLPGWVGEWRMRWHGKDHVWGISGVNYDAAFRDIARGVLLLASGNGAPD